MSNRSHCMNCKSDRLEQFIDLGLQVNGNLFSTAENASQELKLPMRMQVCEDCWQVQIGEFPSPEFLFNDHPYLSGLNVPVVRHFDSLAESVIQELGLAKNSLVLDIGCNDGTLLDAFSRRGMRVLGMDPGSKTGKVARANGKTVCQTFWANEAAEAMKKLELRPDLICATAVFYHIPDLHSFVAGLSTVMTADSVFVVQCVYLLDLIQKNQFDHFYHEHSCIHAVAPLKKLFAAHGLRIQDAYRSEIHGESFICHVVREESARVTTPAVADMIRAEKEAGLFQMETYRNFVKRVEKNREDLRALLSQIKSDGQRVLGLGAPAKGSTLLNYCGIGPDWVEALTEVNPHKIGKVSPGMHIPIVDERNITSPPDYYLMLAWNFQTYFFEKFRSYLLQGGKFIVPGPEVHIVDASILSQVPEKRAA